MLTVVIQLGAYVAVGVYYARRLRELIVDFFAPKSPVLVPRWRHPLVLILVAVVPAGVIGLLAKNWIEAAMEHARPIGVALLVGAILIELIERACRGRGWVHDPADVST